MLSSDLAELYGVEVRVMNQAVRRHLDRFPEDFMFQLSKKEFDNLKSQIVTSSWGGLRKPPLAFTEPGVAMLSSVLNSDRAIRVNIEIMRAFIRIRNVLFFNEALARKVEALSKKVEIHDKAIVNLIREIQRLMAPPQKPEKTIGFRQS